MYKKKRVIGTTTRSGHGPIKGLTNTAFGKLKRVTSGAYLGRHRELLEEFRQADFRGEIISHDMKSVHSMFRDSTFWIAMFMGILPLMIMVLAEGERALSGLLFFFAIMWAGIFKGFILSSVAPIRLPVAAFFFTGIVGIGGLLLYHRIIPDFYLHMNASSSHLASLIGYIVQTGLNEELCKLIPLLAYLVFKRQKWSVEEALLIGVFSGLGFAAFENIHYSLGFARDSASSVYGSVYRETAASRAYQGTIVSMTSVMVRSLSCLFGHTVYTGIATCFVIAGTLSRKGRLVKYFLALAIPAVIHGGYDWLLTRFTFGAAAINAVGFALFFGYLNRTRKLVFDMNWEEPHVEEVVGEIHRQKG